jgi:rhodanese-related sulfurtransferase
VGQWDSSQGVITANEKNDIVHNDLEIGDVALAKELYDSQKFTFVDARSRDDYDEAHIKGAVSLITALSINLIRGHEFNCGCFFRFRYVKRIALFNVNLDECGCKLFEN